jgi:hypothetical protein
MSGARDRMSIQMTTVRLLRRNCEELEARAEVGNNVCVCVLRCVALHCFRFMSRPTNFSLL